MKLAIRPLRREQAGAALVVALIMLVLVTLIAAVSSTAVQTNLKIVQNVESRAMAENVADSAIDQLVAENDPNAFLGAKLFFDADGDGTPGTEIAVTTARRCITVRPILNDSLNMDVAEDRGCYSKVRHPASRCADVLWEVDVTVIDSLTRAQLTVSQGLEVRTDVDDLANC